MLSHHQTNCVFYLNDHGEDFIHYVCLPTHHKSKIIVINEGDLLKFSVTYLKETIKKEMVTYEQKCVRHIQLVDMFIEMNVIEIPSDFSETLEEEATQQFRGTLYTQFL